MLNTWTNNNNNRVAIATSRATKQNNTVVMSLPAETPAPGPQETTQALEDSSYEQGRVGLTQKLCQYLIWSQELFHVTVFVGKWNEREL